MIMRKNQLKKQSGKKLRAPILQRSLVTGTVHKTQSRQPYSYANTVI
jgi:hypothetical protein